MTPHRILRAGQSWRRCSAALLALALLAGCGAEAVRADPVRPDARVISEVATPQTLPLISDEQGRLYVDCMLDDRHGLFLIDTGGDFIGLSAPALASFGLAPSGRRVAGRSAFGDTMLDTVASARIAICPGITLVASNLPVFPKAGHERTAGVIGGGVLALLGATIDYHGKSLTLHP